VSFKVAKALMTATFQIIESLVGAFGGFAQMLESTFMATHSSFFAMVSVGK
jgi:peroxin-13